MKRNELSVPTPMAAFPFLRILERNICDELIDGGRHTWLVGIKARTVNTRLVIYIKRPKYD